MSERARPEQQLHRAVAHFLSVALGGNAWITTVPLGGGGKIRGKILRGLGTKDGVPDILIVDAGRAVWIELKSDKGRVSPVQRECHKAIRLAGSVVEVCRSLDEVIACLKWAGVPLKIHEAA